MRGVYLLLKCLCRSLGNKEVDRRAIDRHSTVDENQFILVTQSNMLSTSAHLTLLYLGLFRKKKSQVLLLMNSFRHGALIDRCSPLYPASLSDIWQPLSSSCFAVLQSWLPFSFSLACLIFLAVLLLYLPAQSLPQGLVQLSLSILCSKVSFQYLY